MTRLDQPYHAAAPASMAQVEPAVAASMLERVQETTERWHRQLLSQLKSRPQPVVPGDDLLDHMSCLVRHVVSTVVANDEISEEILSAAHTVADHWRDAGYSVEEALLNFRVLSDVLHEELSTVIEAAEPQPSPAEVARIAHRLSRGSALVQAVLVGHYRDREEERFAEYASALSHEVRGPLSSAVTTVQTLELLEERQPAESRDEGRYGKLERLERMLWQIRDVLDAVGSLVMPGQKMERNYEQKPLREVVSSVLEEFRDNPNDVVVECDDDIPDVAVDSEPILLALHNLVQNAVAYSDPEKPRRWVRVRCEYDAPRNHLLLRVRDNGLGIAEDEREVIFRRFRRGGGARGSGHGLGLSIVREVAARVEGEVTVDSELGEGSTFTFMVPVEHTTPAAAGTGTRIPTPGRV